MSAAEITARLRAVHDQNPDVAVLVAGDRDASYQHVTDAISCDQGTPASIASA